MVATDLIPIDTSMDRRPRLEPRSGRGTVLDKRARMALLERRGGQGDEGKFLREAAMAALESAALGTAGDAVAREAYLTARHLAGRGPAITLPIGPRGMANVRKAKLATAELEATKARLPGETADLWFAQPRLSAVGRGALKEEATLVDSLAARFARRGPDGEIPMRRMVNDRTMEAAYPVGTADTTVYFKDLGDGTMGGTTLATSRMTAPKIRLTPRSAEQPTTYRETLAHEYTHSLMDREPIAASDGRLADKVVYDRIRAFKDRGPVTQEVLDQAIEDFAYSTTVRENSARIVGGMNATGARDYPEFLRSPMVRKGEELGARVLRVPSRTDQFPVYLDESGLQEASPGAIVPPFQLDDKGGGSRHENFRNFLATDEVPESIFGYPVVQDESRYTESDLEFFRENPKAAGFYDTGDEDEVAGDTPQQLRGGGNSVPETVTAPDDRGLAEMVTYGRRLTGDERAEMAAAEAERNRPKLVPVTPGERAYRAYVDEEARRRSGVFGTGLGAVPKRVWDSMDAVAKDEMSQWSERAASMVLAAGVPAAPAKYITVPGLKLRGSDVASAKMFNGGKYIDPAGYAVWVNNQLTGKNSAGLLLDKNIPILHDPQFILDRLERTGWSASPEALRKAGIVQLNALPRHNLKGGLEMSPAEIQAFENGVLPVKSLYGKAVVGRTAAGQPIYTAFRLSDHVNTVVPVRGYTGAAGGKYWDLNTSFEGVPVDPRILNSRAKSRGSFDLFVPQDGGTGIRFDWQERYGLPGLFGGPRLGGPGEWGGVGRGAHQAAKGGNARRGVRADDLGGKVRREVAAFKDHVRSFETLHREPYVDVDGNLAVGYGSHFLVDGRPVTRENARYLTDRDFDAMFRKDMVRRIDLLSGHDPKQARYAIPGWRHMSPESRLMLLDVAWGRKETLTAEKSPGLFDALRAAGSDTARLDEAVRLHYPSYRKARDGNGNVDESKTKGLQNRRIALYKALTGEDFSYEGKVWDPVRGFVTPQPKGGQR